ncbi:MAG: hypothetical protein II857_05730 [Selenomonadaceae bacterium]|nr:hypothetical protein [Selenomonadaceae bacterium]
MFIKDIYGFYVNADCVEYFTATVDGKVRAYTTVVCDGNQEDYYLAECESEEAAQKWLDDLMEDLGLVRRSLK